MSNTTTKKRVKNPKTSKCQRPGVSAEIWINNNIAKSEVTSCQPQQDSEEQTAATKMSKIAINGAKRDDGVNKPGMSNATDNTICRDKFGNDSLGETTVIGHQGTSMRDCNQKDISGVGANMKTEPSDKLSNNFADSKRKSEVHTDKPFVDLTTRTVAGYDVKVDEEHCVESKMDETMDYADKESGVGLKVETFDQVRKVDNKGSVDSFKTLQKQYSMYISNDDVKSNHVSVHGINAKDQLTRDFQRAQSMHQSLPQLSKDISLDFNQVMDLRGAQSLQQISNISKDVTFLRKHRRTSSLQLARRMSSDLTTIPEEFEKRRSAEHNGFDFKDSLPTASTVNNINHDKWNDHDRYGLSNIHSTSFGDCIIKENTTRNGVSTKQNLPTKPHDLKSAQVITNTNNLPKTTGNDCEGVHCHDNNIKPSVPSKSNKPSVPSKPKKGDKNFKRFKEAGEHIKKSVRTRKHKEQLSSEAAPQDNSRVSKTKSDRNTRRKVFHSKKTRDANCKISRDTSQASSQEDVSPRDVSKNTEKSKKTSSVYRTTRSRGAELFKSLREKNGSGGGGGGGGNRGKGKVDVSSINDKISFDNVKTTSAVSLDVSFEEPSNERHFENDATTGGTNHLEEQLIEVDKECDAKEFGVEIDQGQCDRKFTNSLLNVCENGWKYGKEVESSRNISKYESAESKTYKTDEDLLSAYGLNDNYKNYKAACGNTHDGEYVPLDTMANDKTSDNDMKIDDNIDDSDKMDDLESDTTESDRTYTTASDDYTSCPESSNYTTSDKQSGIDNDDDDDGDKSSIDAMTMQLDWKRRAYSRTREDSEDDREWAERSRKMTKNIEWLRTEIVSITL